MQENCTKMLLRMNRIDSQMIPLSMYLHRQIKIRMKEQMTRNELITELERMLRNAPDLMTPMKVSKCTPIGKNRVYEIIKNGELGCSDELTAASKKLSRQRKRKHCGIGLRDSVRTDSAKASSNSPLIRWTANCSFPSGTAAMTTP